MANNASPPLFWLTTFQAVLTLTSISIGATGINSQVTRWNITPSYYQSNQCESDQWPNFFCSFNTSNSCFTMQETCDGHRDCENAEDECHSMCVATFQCSAPPHKCIAMDEFCDGIQHCPDGSDEIVTTNTSNGFSCVNAWRAFRTDVQGYDWKEKRVSRNIYSLNQWKGEAGKKCLLPDNLVCDGVNHCGDHADECSEEANCPENRKFYCNNSRCVSQHNVCDGYDDCGDGSDECSGNCKNVFYCLSGQCISINKYCDGTIDCDDGSDEVSSKTSVSGNGDFFSFTSCSNIANLSPLRCYLPQYFICDGVEHCIDREDECSDGCSYSFVCPNGKCIVSTKKCDEVDDCGDMKDECNEDCYVLFTCNNGTCLSLDRFCDGINDCLEGEDEIVKNPGTKKEQDVYCTSLKAVRNKSSQKNCLLPPKHVCDGWSQCEDRTDECQNSCNSSFFCDNHETCISRAKVGNEQIDCRDETDEPGLGLTTHYQRGFKCRLERHGEANQHVLPQQLVGDDVADCFDHIDLCTSSIETKSASNCYHCITAAEIVIAKRQICDGIIDCPDLSDECLCEENIYENICNILCSERFSNQDEHTCIKNPPDSDNRCTNDSDEKNFCVPASFVCNGVSECQDGIDELHCGVEATKVREKSKCKKFQPNNHWTPEFAVSCDNRPECMSMEDECDSNCDPLPNYCNHRSLSGQYVCPEGRILAGRSVCNGRNDCESGFDEVNCTDRFYCSTPGSLVINIHKSEVCDFIQDCEDDSDEMNCSQTHFYCEKEGSPKYIRRQQMMDGKRDCADGSDECPQKLFNDSVFSSNLFLIKQPFLQFMIWLMGLIAVVGNIIAIVYTLIRLSKFNRNKMTRIAIINYLLIINLGFADLLMGIFLISLAIKNSLTSFRYCDFDRSWRSSLTCQSLGVMAILSAQASLSTLSILASYRLYCVLKPIKSRCVKIEKSLFAIVCTWVIGIALALPPLYRSYENYFVTDLWINGSPYFHADVVSKGSLATFCKSFRFYNSSQSSCETNSKYDGNCTDWSDIIKTFELSYPNSKILGKFGYYSVHATCLPKLFQTPSDSSWEFSFGIIMFNFIQCVYIVAAYVVLWRTRHVKKSGISSQSNKSLQRRIAVLVVSNCACWLPICTIAFFSFAGISVYNSSYAFTAIILFPINSALNPVFYSNVFHLLWTKFSAFLYKSESFNKLRRNINNSWCKNCRRKSKQQTVKTEVVLLPQSPQSLGSSRVVTEMTSCIDYSTMHSSEV